MKLVGFMAVTLLLFAGVEAKSPDPPASGSEIATASGQGQIDAIISFCITVDPVNASGYRRLGKLVAGASYVYRNDGDHDGDDDPNKAYNASYKAITQLLHQIPKPAAVQTCRNGLK